MMKCDDARRMLSYCYDALNEIKSEKPTGATWERRWASLMALLRTACGTLEREAPDWWRSEMKARNANIRGRDVKKNWKPEIFGKFIWANSNLFLHEGKSTTGQSAMIYLQPAVAYARAAGEPPHPVSSPEPRKPAEIYYHFNTGHYTSCDPFDVADQAISWLQRQVDDAEK